MLTSQLVLDKDRTNVMEYFKDTYTAGLNAITDAIEGERACHDVDERGGAVFFKPSIDVTNVAVFMSSIYTWEYLKAGLELGFGIPLSCEA